MNKDNAKDFLPLVQALVEGREIQYFYKGRWIDMDKDGVAFTGQAENYRIKPEPAEFEVWYKNTPEFGLEVCRTMPDNVVGKWKEAGFRKIKVREVLE